MTKKQILAKLLKVNSEYAGNTEYPDAYMYEAVVWNILYAEGLVKPIGEK